MSIKLTRDDPHPWSLGRRLTGQVFLRVHPTLDPTETVPKLVGLGAYAANFHSDDEIPFGRKPVAAATSTTPASVACWRKPA
ncbi:hypothetical protein AB0J90_26615 [Micromonospora sp. NPDC049523]|uniref:hypothetical protein n=1 Tax=Micromonospora sp. NPDC049523 TaxID=3155921 RepID=UPI00343D6110